MSEWISVDERMPPACQEILVYRRNKAKGHSVVTSYYVSTRPAECVVDDGISHWMPLPGAPS